MLILFILAPTKMSFSIKLQTYMALILTSCFLLPLVSMALAAKLPGVLEEELTPSIRKVHVNMVKMTSYLLCQFIEMLESDETKPSTVITKVKLCCLFLNMFYTILVNLVSLNSNFFVTF